jgi:hypothetical protein
MELLFPPTALFLVCVLPEKRDLEIARLLGWYRIPFRFAPKMVDVDYLAFYQTGAFDTDHRWKIEYIAEVRGHELTTRSELLRDEPDHPRAKEEYYKIQIGPLIALNKCIKSGKWKRFTFQYTTGEKLASADYLRDLSTNDDERKILWHALREKAILAGEYAPKNLPESFIDPEILLLLGKASFSENNYHQISESFNELTGG